MSTRTPAIWRTVHWLLGFWKLTMALAHVQPECFSRQAYRKWLGTLIERDQDVFHIIATANGGADHPDNYDFARGSSWNRAIGRRFDDINCYQVGKIKCAKAVRISQLLGSHSCSNHHPKQKKYTGRTAMELYVQGEAAMRDLRAKRRKEEKQLRETTAFACPHIFAHY